MSPSPLFTFIIPTFNPGDKLARTVESILAQSEGDVQIRVEDGGSSDQTLEYLQNRTDLEWQSAPDAGLYDAMNRGIDHARGAWLAFYGAGDTLSEGALSRLRPTASTYRDELAIIYGNTWFCDENRSRGHHYSHLHLRKDMPCHQSTFYQRRVFDLVGRYNLRYTINADWAYDIVCWGDARIRKIYHPSVIARYEGGGISANGTDTVFYDDDQLLLVKQHLGKVAWLMKMVEDPILNHLLRPLKRKVITTQNKIKAKKGTP
ncbi:MAG TPA: glycosyltransferase [Abditibacterium sp.]|jgi:glycosyltransferase involved in cell wall biosynthesis